jgi:serine/threonine protein phosphatase PrpC
VSAESESTSQINRQKSNLKGHRSSFAIVNEHKQNSQQRTPGSIAEGDEKKEVSVSVSVGNGVTPGHYMTALKSGQIRQQSFKDPTGFRQRRGSFSQGVVEDPENKEVFEQRRTTMYASSEIGIEQSYTAPFPPHILGTFSCHGIAPAEEAEPDDMMRAMMGAGSDDNKGKIHQKTNQDRGCVVYPFAGSSTSALLMVLDGHGDQGDRVAEFVMRQIVLSVETHPELKTNPMTALSESFVATNKALVITKEIKAMTSGTTVVAAYMTGNTLYVANVGDSRAVLATKSEGDDTKVVAKMLSVDHKPDSPEEFQRITKKRGYVSMSRGNESFISSDFNGDLDADGNTFDPERLEEQKKKAGPSCSVSARVWLNPEHTLVGLAMSRSIGDLAVKRVGVIPDPDVFQFEIDPAKDKFLLLASDGVWEFIENQVRVCVVFGCCVKDTYSRLFVFA